MNILFCFFNDYLYVRSVCILCLAVEMQNVVVLKATNKI